jgi:hypothetical protein
VIRYTLSPEEFEALEAEADGKWLTRGPFTCGASGLMFARGRIWWFEYDDYWTPHLSETTMSPEDFLAEHGESTGKGYVEAVAWLRAKGLNAAG